jgi:hypothetical protein
MNQMVRHVKTGNEYMIVGTPKRYRIEATGEPAYAYTISPVDEIWVRKQTEMEDGRFVAV